MSSSPASSSPAHSALDAGTGAAPVSGQLSGRAKFLGAMFLMATSAIGPGFITQTTTFTAQLRSAFAFAILASILFDIAIQLNVWRIVGVAGRRAQDLANSVVPGGGYVLAALDVLGGLVFNIGNVAGTSLGLNAIFGLDVRIGGAISAAMAIAIFLVRRAGVAMDRAVVLLGVVMIGLTTFVAIKTQPPAGEALRQTVAPDQISFLIITTLIGGTVGGYIVYAGAHRLVDNGISGERYVGQITRSSITGVIITGVMRVLLFLAILGVVAAGKSLDPANPTASAFDQALGTAGKIVFGVIIWCAAVTSVIGASYTSTSFLKVLGGWVTRWERWVVCGFIVVSTAIFLVVTATPVKLLIFAGAFNGLILPFGLGVLLWIAARRRDLLGGYRYPAWLLVIGVVAWVLTIYLGYDSITGLKDLF
ncbi:NRAMP family divalent metal transporter [Nocardioides terrisoli]|uniref:NRAMP family divalent metal transporter n=1 Tax=Nocardioides terrisoli TaxID=3388267 RepID=UPI00287B70EA|nr:divalent metal cation transporter [Nocardioides marmorisolisilvae]